MSEIQKVGEGFFYVEWTGAPCPFCGEVGVSGKSPAGCFFAGCPDADCLAHQLAYDFVTVDHARAAWNARTPSLVSDEVEALKHDLRRAQQTASEHATENERLKADNERMKEGLEWQSIDCAPRVHGRMILSFNRYGAMDIICWNDSTGGWDDGVYRDDAVEYREPRFWMPLPAAPDDARTILQEVSR